MASDSPGLSPILKTASNGEEESIGNVKEFIFDKNNEFVIGYKTFSGETYPTLTMDEMKAFWGIPDDSTPTPTPVPTPTPINTDKPIATQKPTAVGSKVVSKYKLKKGVLTWKGTKKSIKVKQVKQVSYIEKSQNLIYMTKKGAKKLIFKNDYVTRIKKKSGYMNVANK